MVASYEEEAEKNLANNIIIYINNIIIVYIIAVLFFMIELCDRAICTCGGFYSW